MGQDDNANAMFFILWLITILLSIGSGILAWNWVNPESFWGAIGFIILWGILSKIAHYIMMGIIYALFNK